MGTTILGLSLTLLIFSLLPFVAFSHDSPKSINWWCNQTPYPEPCEHSMSQLPLFPSSSLKQRSEFYKLTVAVALDQAIVAYNHTKSLGDKCRNKQEKAAWTECLEHYENTIVQLNSTLDPLGECTTFNKQTWLSAAMTNLDTCRTGFVELGVADTILPLMSNNVSELISNSLAMNKINLVEEKYKDGFPSWLSGGDWKLLQAASPIPQADLVVVQDGSGNFRTINEAVDAASKQERNGSVRFVIYVKAGTYRENVVIGKELTNLMFVGDGVESTIVTGNKSMGEEISTFHTATFGVTGDRFMARDITFRNTAGPQNHQAVALRSSSDFSVFYLCSFEGYQDTLYVHSQNQFYRECFISGTVDFIFGNAAAVLQNCTIYVRRPMNHQKNTITAQGRKDLNQTSGISIHDSSVLAAPDLISVQGSFKTFLGRPWKDFSRTVFLLCFIDSLIDPAGWLEWNGDFALNTLYYGEYGNVGPGSSTSGRVKWGGYRVITSPLEASQFDVGNFIAGGSWLPSTGVPFTSRL